MSETEDPKESFKVVDKRRFAADGEVKSGVESRAYCEPAAAIDIAPKSEVKSEEQAKPSEPISSVDFSSFLVGLATQAMALMGEISHPELEGTPLNLDAARQTIDILSMLEEKTKGNLSAAEEQLISDVLSNLKMAYVNKSQSK